MPALFPPEYPLRPDAPLLSFGPSFSEEIARSVIAAVWLPTDDPHDGEVRIAASLTMLEAFHPRDHLECMLAAQGVAGHCMIMECFRRAMSRETSEAVAIKLRANVSQLSRTFSTLLHDLERRQGKPLPERPPEPAPKSEPPPDDSPPGGADRAEPATTSDAGPEPPEDLETRADGSPGSLTAYAPKSPPEVLIPCEPAIMTALATRPKPWRMVNAPRDEGLAPAEDPVPEQQPAYGDARGPLDLTERMFTGDALARFTSSRLDPNAAAEPPPFEQEESVVELELISTGGDPEAEAHRAALIAAHPEGKPIATYRYGGKISSEDAANDT
jgi:hypothetical protein